MEFVCVCVEWCLIVGEVVGVFEYVFVFCVLVVVELVVEVEWVGDVWIGFGVVDVVCDVWVC